VRDDDFPHRTCVRSSPTRASTASASTSASKQSGYQDFLKQKEEAKARALLGIGISTMTEPLGAGNSRRYDILGIKMFDSAELRVT
jgi:carbon-monoxide dehydrogenase large subunit